MILKHRKMNVPGDVMSAGGQGGAPGPAGNNIQSIAAKYSVNLNNWEAVDIPLYDFQAYPAAGSTQFTFFALPIGQGGKTLSDTNLNLAGQLPANQQFLIETIEVQFFPTVPAVAADNPAAFGAGAVANLVNDVYKVHHHGNITLTIGSKTYAQIAPVGRAPARANFQVSGALADATTAAADLQSRIAYAYNGGQVYRMRTPYFLIQNQNFQVTVNYPEGVGAITNPGRIGVILQGVLFRKSQ